MWTKEMFGTDVYHLVLSFILYSMLGWLVESIYMSVCNRKLTNRGFAKSPLCPIYGFGGVLGCIVLQPLADRVVLLYIAGAAIATLFEFFVAKLMLKVFGAVWWDYNDKPFNYKGIICLESTLAWGIYAIVIVRSLNTMVLKGIDLIPVKVGIAVSFIVFLIYGIDFFYHFLAAMGVDVDKYPQKMIQGYRQFRGKH